MGGSLEMSDRHYRPWQLLFAPGDLVKGPLLVIAPHPDDEVIGPGGLVHAHLQANAPVSTLVMTDGAGGDPTGSGGDDYTERRRSESRNASGVLGGTEITFLDFPDGGLAGVLDEGSAAVDSIARALDETQCETVLFPSPYEVHPDHRASCYATLAAVEDCSRSPRLLAYEVGEAMPCNLLINITDAFQTKTRALRCFESQLEHHDLESKMEALNRARAVNCDDPEVKYCEAYLRIVPGAVREFLGHVDTVVRLTDSMTPDLPYG